MTFTPIETGVGAILLHQVASILLYQNGKVLGASGYLRRLFSTPTKTDVAFFAGMAASFLPLRCFLPELSTRYPPAPSTLQQALVAVGVGLLVGWGTKVSNGCTSGHMLCGLSRLNSYSAIAVATFFSSALVTHHLAHPSLLTEVCVGDTPCYLPSYPPRATTASLVLLASVVILAAQTIPHLVARLPAKRGNNSGSDSPARAATQFLAGLEFGLGLQISQMSNPAKVTSFLSFPQLSVWDPSMALVIVFGILPSLAEQRIRGFSSPPSFNDKYEVSQKTFRNADWKFVLGAAVFGVGWGMTGSCPGPAILRSFAQPVWGLCWMGGFWLGGRMR